MIDVGIVGVGTYLPEKTMKAAEIAGLTNGVWSEDAVINKLGIKQRYLPGPDDGTQEMGAKAALKCLENTGVDPKEIDVILCIGEEWKEYPLTTSACYIQDRIGATNAWGIDVQNRCCTCVSAMKIAADMLRADDEINTIMICGGYRNGDFVDFTDKNRALWVTSSKQPRMTIRATARKARTISKSWSKTTAYSRWSAISAHGTLLPLRTI